MIDYVDPDNPFASPSPTRDFYPDVLLEGLAPHDDFVMKTKPGVPPGFDLTALMSESMRARPVWNDMARVASRVLYDYVEKTRIAMQLGRDPESLSRVLKIVALKMLGIDWRSDKLTDADYDRVLEAVTLYQQNHGPQDFVAFMGYALGVPLEMMKLWTKDYAHLTLGPSWGEGVVYGKPGGSGMDKEGPWYPTSHVAILYEEFAANADKVDIPALTDLFYRMAPIHLVLEFIASQVTLRLTLFVSTKFFEGSEDTVIARSDPRIPLYLMEAHYERSVDTILTEPPHPNREVPLPVVVAGQDVGTDRVATRKPGVFWSAGEDLATSGVLLSTSGVEVPSKTGSGAVMKGVDSPAFTDFAGNSGLLVNAARRSSIVNGGNPGLAGWSRGANFVPGTTSLTAGLVCVDVTVTNQAPVETVGIESGSHALRWTLRRVSGATCCAVVRGSSTFVFNLATGAVVQGNASCAVEDLGGGWYSLRALASGDQIKFYPAWGADAAGSGSAAGSYQWYSAQAEKDQLYPTVSFKSGAVRPSLLQPNAILLGNPQQFAYDYGFLLIDAVPWYPEWQAAKQSLLSGVANLGDTLSLDVDTDGRILYASKVGATTYTAKTTAAVSASSPAKVALSWNRHTDTIRLYFAGAYADVASRLPSNLYQAVAMHPLGMPATSTWVVRKLCLTGTSDPAVVSHALLSALTS